MTNLPALICHDVNTTLFGLEGRYNLWYYRDEIAATDHVNRLGNSARVVQSSPNIWRVTQFVDTEQEFNNAMDDAYFGH